MDEGVESAPTPASAPATAPCAVHEGAQATGTCARCGNFVCPLCLDVVAHHDDWCEACREREGGDKMPWEREEGSLISRWWQTTRSVLLHPATTIARTRPGSLEKALAYNALTGLLVGTAIAVIFGLVFLVGFTSPEMQAILDDPSRGDLPRGTFVAILVVLLALMPLINVAYTVLVACFRGAVFQLASLACGGGGGGGDPYWTACYLGASQLTWLPLTIIQQIPVIGLPVAMLGHLVVEIWYALALTEAAERYQGLTQGRAVFTGWAGFLVLVGLTLLCCLGTVFAAVFAAGQV